MIGTLLDKNKDLALVLGTLSILVILFAPIPPALLDLAIIVNFGFGFTILLLTFYVAKPVEFSTFPSILLVATLFRLSLNVAATRLILTGADAGEVIDSIGSYSVQGNFIIGLVVFVILVVVQYVVVTSGAQRVSEVAARFTLDSMPGQQMSIDADLNLGLISQDEAKSRRTELEKQASFYGAMDGASKFVKGDAIAGVIIVLVDIIAGLTVGIAQMGMGWEEALQRFTLLTIGDGIATQLPALIISVATGIIVTRSAADRRLSNEIFKQLASEPRIPLIVAAILLVMLLLPGMPKWPILIVGALAFASWFKTRKTGKPAGETGELEDDGATVVTHSMRSIELRLGQDLRAAWQDRQDLLLDRIGKQRETVERTFGFSHPKVSILEDSELGALNYQIAIFGDVYGSGLVRPDHALALKQSENTKPIEGTAGKDPAYGLDGIWINPDRSEEARKSGYSVVDAETVLTAHLGEVIKSEVSTLLTRAATVELLDQVRDRQPGLVEELIPNMLTASDVQRVLQNLLHERVSIGNIDFILETLVDIGRHEKDPAALSEKLRQHLAVAICAGLRGANSDLAVLSFDPRLENRILANLGETQSENLISADPKLAEQVLQSLSPLVDNMARQGRSPVLLCASPIRRAMVRLVQRAMPHLSVVSVEEIPLRTSLSSFGIVKVPQLEQA
ncbi:MAG: flagellar biosynthesis protein FlhA [Pseudomonadota bacterium]